MYESLHSYNEAMEKCIGSLSKIAAVANNTTISTSGMNKTFADANAHFQRLTNNVRTFSDVLHILGVKEKVAFQEMLASNRAMKEMEVQMARSAVAAKVLSFQMGLVSSNVFTGMSKISETVTNVNNKLERSLSSLNGMIGSSDKKFGDFKGTLLEFNRASIDVARSSAVMGRYGMFDSNFWNRLNRNTSLSKVQFLELYRSIHEGSKGLTMTQNQFLSLSKVITDKFGASIKTVENATQRFLELQNIIPNVMEDMEKMRVFKEITGVDPKGLKSMVLMLNELGASKRSLDFFAKYIERTSSAERAMMQFEKAVADRNKKIENANINMAKSAEESLISIEKTLGNMAEAFGNFATKIDGVTDALVRFSAVAKFAGAATVGLHGLGMASSMLFGAGASGPSGAPGSAGRLSKIGGIGGLIGGSVAAGAILTSGYSAYRSMKENSRKQADLYAAERDRAILGDSVYADTEDLDDRIAEQKSATPIGWRGKLKQGATAAGAIGGSLLGGVVGYRAGGWGGAMKGAGKGSVWGASVGAMIGSIIPDDKSNKQESPSKKLRELQMSWKGITANIKEARQFTGTMPKDLSEALEMISRMKDGEDKYNALLVLRHDLQISNNELLLSSGGKYKQLTEAALKFNETIQAEKETIMGNFLRLEGQVQLYENIVKVSQKVASSLTNVGNLYSEIGYTGDKVTRVYEDQVLALQKQKRALEEYKKSWIAFDNFQSASQPISAPDVADKLTPLLGEGTGNRATEMMTPLIEARNKLSEKERETATMERSEREKILQPLREAVSAKRNEAEQSISSLKIDEKKMPILKTLLDLLGAISDEQYGIARTAKEQYVKEQAINIAINERKAAMDQIGKNYQIANNLAGQVVSLAEKEQQFIENSSLGLAASVEARKKVYDIVRAQRMLQEGEKDAQKIKFMQTYAEVIKKTGVTQAELNSMFMGDSMDSLRAMYSIRAKMMNAEGTAAEELALTYQKILTLNQGITDSKNKELQITMQLREGFLDVIDEMSTGNDVVSKLIPDAQRGQASIMNLGRMIKDMDFGGAMRVGFMSTFNMGAAQNANNAATYGVRNGRAGLFGGTSAAQNRYALETFGSTNFNARWFGGNMDQSDIGGNSPGFPGIISQISSGNDAEKMFLGMAGSGVAVRSSMDRLGESANKATEALNTIAAFLARLTNGQTQAVSPVTGTRYSGGRVGIGMQMGGVIPGTPAAGRDNVFGKLSNGGRVLLSSGETFIPNHSIGGPAGYAMLDAMNKGVEYNLGDGGYVIPKFKDAGPTNEPTSSITVGGVAEGVGVPLVLGGVSKLAQKRAANKILTVAAGRTTSAAAGKVAASYIPGFGQAYMTAELAYGATRGAQELYKANGGETELDTFTYDGNEGDRSEKEWLELYMAAKGLAEKNKICVEMHDSKSPSALRATQTLAKSGEVGFSEGKSYRDNLNALLYDEKMFELDRRKKAPSTYGYWDSFKDVHKQTTGGLSRAILTAIDFYSKPMESIWDGHYQYVAEQNGSYVSPDQAASVISGGKVARRKMEKIDPKKREERIRREKIGDVTDIKMARIENEKRKEDREKAREESVRITVANEMTAYDLEDEAIKEGVERDLAAEMSGYDIKEQEIIRGTISDNNAKALLRNLKDRSALTEFAESKFKVFEQMRLKGISPKSRNFSSVLFNRFSKIINQTARRKNGLSRDSELYIVSMFSDLNNNLQRIQGQYEKYLEVKAAGMNPTDFIDGTIKTGIDNRAMDDALSAKEKSVKTSRTTPEGLKIRKKINLMNDLAKEENWMEYKRCKEELEAFAKMQRFKSPEVYLKEMAPEYEPIPIPTVEESIDRKFEELAPQAWMQSAMAMGTDAGPVKINTTKDFDMVTGKPVKVSTYVSPYGMMSVKGYNNGGFLRGFQIGGNTIDVSRGGVIPGTPAAGRDNRYANFGGNLAAVGSGEGYIPNSNLRDPESKMFASALNEGGEAFLNAFKGFRAVGGDLSDNATLSDAGKNSVVNFGAGGGFITKKSSTPSFGENLSIFNAFAKGGYKAAVKEISGMEDGGFVLPKFGSGGDSIDPFDWSMKEEVSKDGKIIVRKRGSKEILKTLDDVDARIREQGIRAKEEHERRKSEEMAIVPREETKEQKESREIADLHRSSDFNGLSGSARVMAMNAELFRKRREEAGLPQEGGSTRVMAMNAELFRKRRAEAGLPQEGGGSARVMAMNNELFRKRREEAGLPQEGGSARVMAMNAELFRKRREEAGLPQEGGSARVMAMNAELFRKRREEAGLSTDKTEKSSSSSSLPVRDPYVIPEGYDSSKPFTGIRPESYMSSEQLANFRREQSEKPYVIPEGYDSSKPFTGIRPESYMSSEQLANSRREQSEKPYVIPEGYDSSKPFTGIRPESYMSSEQLANSRREQSENVRRNPQKGINPASWGPMPNYDLGGPAGAGVIPGLMGDINMHDALRTGLEVDSGFTDSTISGLRNSSPAGGTTSPTSLYLTGGINVDRLYLSGKLHGEQLKSDGSDFWRGLEVQSRN